MEKQSAITNSFSEEMDEKHGRPSYSGFDAVS
jgi:hypothetical protein